MCLGEGFGELSEENQAPDADLRQVLGALAELSNEDTPPNIGLSLRTARSIVEESMRLVLKVVEFVT
jgi:hypothetical protein